MIMLSRDGLHACSRLDVDGFVVPVYALSVLIGYMHIYQLENPDQLDLRGAIKWIPTHGRENGTHYLSKLIKNLKRPSSKKLITPESEAEPCSY